MGTNLVCKKPDWCEENRKEGEEITIGSSIKQIETNKILRKMKLVNSNHSTALPILLTKNVRLALVQDQ